MWEHHRKRTDGVKAPRYSASFRSRRDELKVYVAEFERVERLVHIAETNEPEGKPISDRIVDLLRANSDMQFSPAEIMDCVHVSDDRAEAVRKALQRLVARGVIKRFTRGEYRINLPMEGVT